MLKQTHNLNLVVAVTGASGALYARSFIRALAANIKGESSLIISDAALRVYKEEFEEAPTSPAEYLQAVLGSSPPGPHSFRVEESRDVGARPASGSAPYDGMVIVPCSTKTLASVSHGVTSNLIERAADVTLKERRPLILVPREAPYNLIHLRNMTALTETGAVILPASPAFYQKPRTFDDLGNFISGRILGLLGVKLELFKSWEG